MNALAPSARERYVSEFARLASQLPGTPGVDAARRLAIERFGRLGFPTQRDEEWRYTSLAALEKIPFALLAPAAAATEDLAALVAGLSLPGASRLVFVDGRLQSACSDLSGLPAGVSVFGLAESLASRRGDAEALFAGASRPSAAFGELNRAFAADGAIIRMAPGVVAAAPLQLIHVARTPGVASHVRHLVEAGEGSSLRLVEQHVGAADGVSLSNTMTRLTLAAGADIEHYKLQDEGDKAFHFAELAVELAAGSRFLSSSFAFGAALARADIAVRLAGEGADCRLDGLYLADGRRQVDHHTRIDHLLPRCRSREFYKGVVAGAARAVFAGRAVVHPGAQKSDAAQINRNLLLSERAEVDSKPQLEIWADDVKCSHGATVGQLDADQIFYLRARGIDEAAARRLLTLAFARELIDRVGLPVLQERLDALLQARLPLAARGEGNA